MKKLVVMLLACLGLTACNGNVIELKGISRTYVNEDGYLMVVYTDGSEENAGYVKGEKGEQGIQGVAGTNGKDGVAGKDGLNGQDGKDGRDGLDGQNGKDGIDGRDGVDGKDGKNGVDGKDGETVYVPTLDLSLITYAADITKVGNFYQYMAIDNLVYTTGCYPEPRLPNMTTKERQNLTAAQLSSNYRLSCWPRGTTPVEIQVCNAIVPSKYKGELSNYNVVDWKYVDYGNCYRSYLLVNAEVTKVIQSMHSKGGMPYYQCIVMYDYALSI